MSAKWPRVRLGEVLTLRAPDTVVMPDEEYQFAGVYSFGRGVFRGQKRLGSEFSYANLTRIREGDFVYPKLMAWEGAFGVVPSECAGCYVSPEFPVFKTDAERLLPWFLEYQLRTPGVWASIAGPSTGTNVRRRRLYPRDLLNQGILLPPLVEQHRIVNRIRGLAANIQEVAEIRASVSLQTERLISARIHQLANSRKWPIKPLRELIGEDCLRNGKSVKPVSCETGIRCLGLSSVRDGKIDLNDSKPVPISVKEAKPYLVNESDVFVVRGNGSKELCGKAAMARGAPTGLIFPDLFIRVGLGNSSLLPEFFVFFWNSGPVRVFIEEKAKTTSGIWKVNQQHIMASMFPSPTLQEQESVVSELKDLQVRINSLRRLQKETVAEVDVLMPAILDRALTAR